MLHLQCKRGIGVRKGLLSILRKSIFLSAAQSVCQLTASGEIEIYSHTEKDRGGAVWHLKESASGIGLWTCEVMSVDMTIQSVR